MAFSVAIVLWENSLKSGSKETQWIPVTTLSNHQSGFAIKVRSLVSYYQVYLESLGKVSLQPSAEQQGTYTAVRSKTAAKLSQY